MLLSFNFVDYLIIIFALVYAVIIGKRGFLAEIAELAGFALSLLFALLLGPIFGSALSLLGIPNGWANLVAFVVLWVAFEFLGLLIFNDLLRKVPMQLILSKFNRYLGYLPNIVNSLLISLFIGSLVVVLPANPSIKYELTQSQILGGLLPFGAKLNQPLNDNFSQAVSDSVLFFTENNEERSLRVNFPNLDESLLVSDEASEIKMLALLNKERAEKGLPALEADTRLREVARSHSKDMFVEKYFGHFDSQGVGPRERLYYRAITFKYAGENLSHAPDFEIAHSGLMNSDYHRENILSGSYTKVGIGIVEAPGYGLMITQLFTD